MMLVESHSLDGITVGFQGMFLLGKLKLRTELSHDDHAEGLGSLEVGDESHPAVLQVCFFVWSKPKSENNLKSSGEVLADPWLFLDLLNETSWKST